MKKFKLIKEYPGSPKLGTIIIETMIISCRPKFKTYTIYGGDINCDMGKFRIDFPENHPEFWEEIVEEDYEILKLKLKKNVNTIVEYSQIKPDVLDSIIFQLYDIYQVKRLSDGEVFTVGDRVTAGFIKKFWLQANNLIVTVNTGTHDLQISLKNLIKKEKPLFTTEDGVDIFEGDKFYTVRTSDFKLLQPYTVYSDDVVHFSTKEAAEEYILMNKPCLSINDVSSILQEGKSYQYHNTTINNLIKLLNNRENGD